MLNKVMLIGNLGKDPEVKYTADGAMITSFSVATTDNYKDKQGAKPYSNSCRTEGIASHYHGSQG